MVNFATIPAAFAVALATTACVSSAPEVQVDLNAQPPGYAEDLTASSAAPDMDAGPAASSDQIRNLQFTAGQERFAVTEVSVTVPDYLVVSEADVFIPKADIVWREDPRGDRRAQVQTILRGALERGTAGLTGRPVILAARVNTFHALTERARETTGGRHNIAFDYVLLDATTGQPVTASKSVDASLRAYGGRKAYHAMRAGQTQKVRISEHVARMIRAELAGS